MTAPAPHPSDAAGAGLDRERISLFDLLTPLVLRWRLVVGFAALGAFAGLVLALVTRPYFTAVTTFTTQTAGGGLNLPAGLGSLVGQLGINLERGGSVSSPAFFVDLAQSRAVRQSLVQSLVHDPDSATASPPRPLLDQLVPRAPSAAVRRERALKRMGQIMRVGLGKTGIVRVEVIDRSPLRAAEIANRLVSILDTFNLERLQFQSRQQRRFSQERLATAQLELRDAEQRQLRFLQTNRLYEQSPLLRFEAAQLERVVQLKSEVMLTLARATEEARISEARDVPTITVVDSAEPPALKAGPKRKLIVLVVGTLGLLLGCVAAYVEHLRAWLDASGQKDYVAFTQALRTLVDQLPRTFRRGARPA